MKKSSKRRTIKGDRRTERVAAATGLLESVVYHYGQSSNTALYSYDGSGRLSEIDDWMLTGTLR